MTFEEGGVDRRFLPVARSRVFNRILDTLGLRSKKILDLGCGFGEYLAHFGKGSVGITSALEEVSYGAAHNTRIVRGNVETIDTLKLGEQFEGVWCNNLFEHVLSPHALLIKLKVLMEDDALLVLGVPVVPHIASLMRLSKFRGPLAVAHINFFTRETLRLTAQRAGWHVDAVRPFIFGNGFLDMLASFFAPHLYVVARNDAQFIYPEKKLKEWQDESLYQDLLHIGNR